MSQRKQKYTIGFTNTGNELVGPMQNQTMTNQTGTAAISANLRRSEFDTPRQVLTGTHQALELSDTTTLLDELNTAASFWPVVSSI